MFLDRRPPQVLAVELEQIEGAKDDALAAPALSQQVEHSQAVRVADDGLAIDQAGPHREGSDGRGRHGKAIGEVEALASVERHAAGSPIGEDTEAVMLDFVNPAGPGRRLLGRAGQARLDAPQLAMQLTRRGHGSLNNRFAAEVESRGRGEAVGDDWKPLLA